MRAPSLLLAVCLAPCACAPPGAPDAGPVDAGAEEDAGVDDVVEESEPNDGADENHVDDLPVGAVGRGFVSAPTSGGETDLDLFRVPTQAGRVYRVVVTAPEGSLLDAHVTVIDAGRDGESAGQDYRQLQRAPAGPSAEVEFLAFGDGGHLVGVRDARNVDAVEAVGGAQHRYEVVVREIPLEEVAGPALSPPDDLTGALDHAGALLVHALDVPDGAEVRADLRAAPAGDFRLWVYSEATKSWIARNDDRADGDLDPLLDAPLFEPGPYLLVVDNVDERADVLAFTLDVAAP